MRRTDALAGVLILAALGGCMRIYADPELPDVTVEWTDFDCRQGTGDVVVALVGFDDTSRVEMAVPCRDLTMTFPDVARQRYRVDGELRDATGAVFSTRSEEVDLRNGINKRVYLFFGGFSNFRVRWTFAMGATCESLAASTIAVRFDAMGQAAFGLQAPCADYMMFRTVPPGTYIVVLEALDEDVIVARSPESAEIVIDEVGLTDLGIVELAP